MRDLNRSSRGRLGGVLMTSVLLVCSALWAPPVAGSEQPVAGQEQEPRPESGEVAPESESTPEGAEVEVAPEAEDSAAEQAERRRHRRSRHRVDKDTQVHVMSDLEIEEDEVAREAVVVMGTLRVSGKVLGDAVSILGPAYIDGEVTGGVTSVGDDIYLGSHAEVLGDVISVGGRVEREPGARVLGEVSEIDIGPTLHLSRFPFNWNFDGPRFWNVAPLGLAWSVFWTVFRWVLLILVTSFVFLVARGAVESTAEAVSAEPWKAGLLGLATWLLFFPLMVVGTIVLALSIIGIPLLIIAWPLGLFALMIACLVGYTAAAYALGGWLRQRFGWTGGSPYLALLLGVVSIQLLSLLAEILGSLGGVLWFFALMFGLAGWLVRFSVWTVGLGATMMAFAERRRLGKQSPPPPAASPAPTSLASPAPEAPALDGGGGPGEGEDGEANGRTGS